MTMFLIQSAILIAIAFVTGCIIGCLLRRMFAVEAVVQATVPTPATALPHDVAPVPELASSTDVAPAAMMSPAAVASKPKSAPRSKAAMKPEVAVALTPPVKNVPAKSSASTKSALIPKAQGEVTSSTRKPSNTDPALAIKRTAKPVSAKAKKPIAAKLAKPVGGKPDNLTLINGIGNVIEKKLHGLGVFHFEQIATWTMAEAEDASKAVGFPGRAIRENWMKEAAIFIKGGTTDHARKVEAGDVSTSRKSTAVEQGKKK